MTPSTPTADLPADTTADEAMISVAEYIVDDSHGIPVAGMLAQHPELADTLLTRADWDAKLAGYRRHVIKD